MARKILELAKEHDIPVHEDSVLSDMLSAVQAGEQISPDTFRLVAEVLCFLYAADKQWREEHPHMKPLVGRLLEQTPESDDGG